MKNVCVTGLSIMMLLISSCKKIVGDGPIETESRTETGYSGIDLRMQGTVYYTQDSVYKIELSAQRNILDEIYTYVSDNKLVIKVRDGVRLKSHEPIKAMVTAPALTALRISGSGDIITTNAFPRNDINLDVSGSGSITIAEINAGYGDANISGSGNIQVNNGTIGEEKLKISGSGNIELSNVSATKASTTTSGSGDIKLKVSDYLNVTISGSGSVLYVGNPLIDTHISGSGKVLRY